MYWFGDGLFGGSGVIAEFGFGGDLPAREQL